MAIYEYQCNQHGVFEAFLPIGTAPATVACDVCGAHSPRIYSAPMLRNGKRPSWTAAIDQAEKSRYEPEVVTSLPPTRSSRYRTVPLTPTLRGLPRP